MKNVGSRFTALILMLILCAVLAVYRAGWFDVTFVTRPAVSSPEQSSSDSTKNDTSSTTSTSSTSSDSSDSVDSSSSVSDSSSSVGTSDTSGEGSGSDTPSELLFIPYKDAKSEGYNLSYSDWVTGSGWVLAASDVKLPSYFSSTSETVFEITHEISKDKTEVIPVYTEKTQARPALKLYMGYILTETSNKNRTNIYSSSGKLLGSYDRRDVSPAWCRDGEDRPLFIYKDAYYYLDEAKKTFVESDYDPDRDGRGAEFDYTPDYGKDSDGMKFLSIVETVFDYELIEGKFDEKGYPLAYKIPRDIYKFALAKSKGDAITEYSFFGKYPFSEKLAAVIDADDHLYYIDNKGKTVINGGSSRLDTSLGRRVYEYYMEPVTNGTESIGFYFFEHGITRARVTLIDKYYFDQDGTVFVVGDEDVLIYDDGSRFPVPVGYDIISYSNGMILLSKDGKYGYMSYTGEWIVDPYLTYAEPFYEGLAVVGKGSSRALIDVNGKEIIPFGQFSHISNASSGLIAVYGDDGWKVLYKCEK